MSGGTEWNWATLFKRYLNDRHANKLARVQVELLDVCAPAVLSDSDFVRQQLLFKSFKAGHGKPLRERQAILFLLGNDARASRGRITILESEVGRVSVLRDDSNSPLLARVHHKDEDRRSYALDEVEQNGEAAHHKLKEEE